MSHCRRAAVRAAMLCILTSVLAVPCAGQDASAGPKRNFSFIHMSDTHVEPYPTTAPESLIDARSYAGIQTIARLGTVSMPPFGVTAPRPEFALVTGDVTEFGFPGITPEVVDTYFKDLGMPIYFSTGNHDNTQVAMPDFWRQRHGGQNYSFESNGCHFIALNSASLQDPHPSFGEEVLNFLKNDLKKVRPSTPVFVYFHHPLNSGEFASAYDTDRILDALRRHNVVALLVGHGHSAVTLEFAGIDSVMGGSTFLARNQKPGQDGFGVCYVQGDKLLYAYHSFNGEGATKKMLEKTIAPYSDYPAITISSPEEGSTVTDDRIGLAVGVAGTTGTLSEAEWSLDDETTGSLKVDGAALYTGIPAAGLDPGAHFIRVTFKDESGRRFQKSTAFYYEPGKKAKTVSSSGKRTGQAADDTSPVATARWRYRMGGASKATPLVTGGRVYVGANDGKFRALDARTGRLVWEYDAGAEILTTALRHRDLVLFGSGNGKFHALRTSTGRPAWTFDAGVAVYSSPVTGPGGEVFFGTNRAEVIALNASTGKLLWRNSDAVYSIETPPIVVGDRVYFGAWDGLIYCVDRKTGKTLWKKPGPRNQERVVRYFAPADAPLVAADGKLYVADRGYMAGIYRISDGDFQTTFSVDSTSLALAEDGKALYSRGTKTPVIKVGLDGQTIWESDCMAGRIPVPPTVSGGRLYVCTNTGVLHALDAESGKTLWKYRVTPKLYVMSGVAISDGTAYTTGFDGVVTAIELPRK